MYKPVLTIPEFHNCWTVSGIEASVCIRNFIGNKSVKFGLKLWDLADNLTGYIYKFLFCTGKSTETYNYGSVYWKKDETDETFVESGIPFIFW